MDHLKTLKVQIEDNPHEPIIGFISKTDTLALQVDLSNEYLKLVRTVLRLT